MNIDEKSPLPAWVCIEHAHYQNDMYRDSFKPAEVKLGNRVNEMAAQAYNCRVFKNYRQGFIAVKVEKPSITDKNGDRALKLNEFCFENGIEVHVQKSNIIFRIPQK